jgi:hypothetical protein
VRTTVSISDELLATGDRPAVPVFRGGTGARPGVDLTSNQALHEALDDRLALDRRR